LGIQKDSICFFFVIYPVFFVLASLAYFKLPTQLNDSTIIILASVLSGIVNLSMGLYQTGGSFSTPAQA
jgi:hypothetical protein